MKALVVKVDVEQPFLGNPLCQILLYLLIQKPGFTGAPYTDNGIDLAHKGRSQTIRLWLIVQAFINR